MVAEASEGDAIIKLLLEFGRDKLKRRHTDMIARFRRSAGDRELLLVVEALGGRTDEDLSWSDYTERLRLSQPKPLLVDGPRNEFEASYYAGKPLGGTPAPRVSTRPYVVDGLVVGEVCCWIVGTHAFAWQQ
jgi:hypothetical protein